MRQQSGSSLFSTAKAGNSNHFSTKSTTQANTSQSLFSPLSAEQGSLFNGSFNTSSTQHPTNFFSTKPSTKNIFGNLPTKKEPLFEKPESQTKDDYPTQSCIEKKQQQAQKSQKSTERKASGTTPGVYKALLPPGVFRKDISIKKVFLTAENSIIVWVQHTKELNNDLVLIKQNGQAQWFCLPNNVAPLQLNKKQILISLKDGSIDQLCFDNQKWTMSNVRPNQNVFSIHYTSEIMVFTQSQSYCISEKFNKNMQKLTFCDIENGAQKIKNEIFIDCRSQKLRQLNDYSKVGQLISGNCLRVIDLQKSQDTVTNIPLSEDLTCATEEREITAQTIINQIYQISQDKYLICTKLKKIQNSSNQANNKLFRSDNFLIVDSKRYNRPGFITKLYINENNKKIFNYDQYGFKIFGQFVVCWENQLNLMDPTHLNLVDPARSIKLNRERDVYLGIKINAIFDERIGPSNVRLNIKETTQTRLLENQKNDFDKYLSIEVSRIEVSENALGFKISLNQ